MTATVATTVTATVTATEPADPRPGRRVRSRLLLTVVGVVTLASLALSMLAYVLVARSLQAEVLDRAIEEARFNVEVLAAERLDGTVRPGDIETSGLADDLQRRGVDVYVDLGGEPGDDYVSGLDVVNVPEVLSAELRNTVAEGRVGAQWVELDGVPHLVVGARNPPAGPDFYFLTDVSDTRAALAQLRRVLLGASLVLVLLGAIAGWRGARLAGSLADTVAELTAARHRERRFVADVSHELRTPVTALVQEADELAARIEEFPPATRRVVELLDGDVRRLRDLVEELLELSRLDRTDAAADIEVTEIDVGRLLAAIAARRLPQAQVAVPAELRVRTDRRRLERIVANLVDNARAHGGGADRGPVTIGARLEGATLVVEVADRGPGVADDQLERIFDRFSKADAARGGGSGLGLAIVREHARLLGAEVTARNRDSGGLEVQVRLPVEVVADL
ncbi:MAG: HAMP domain-containing sensor histidine kinase [Nitriliruptoraceae bacterium]